MQPDWDVVVVGRSFAGLSATLTLARMRRSVLVIGRGGPRNEAVVHAHGLLTRDGADPNDLVAAAVADVARYPTVELVDGRVTAIDGEAGGFRVTFDGRMSTAATVILATGVNDDPLPIPGLAEHWGRGVFTCPFCDGFEHRDLPLAVVGVPSIVPHVARLLTAVSDQVTVYAALEGEVTATLGADGVTVDDREIVRVVGDGTAVTSLDLADGATVKTGALFMARLPHPNNQLAHGLGCIVDEMGFVTTDAMGRTNVDGVWAAGDLTTMHHQIAIAIAQGATAGSDCVRALILGSH